MFKKKNKSNKKVKSFDDWAKEAKEYLDDTKTYSNDRSKDRSSYQTSSNKKAYRKLSDNIDVSELFPKNPNSKNNKKSNNIDKKSYEGDESIRGSIKGSTMMGPEGDPVNDDLRRKLSKKKEKDKQKEREEAYARKKEAYGSKESKKNYNVLKKKKELRKAILYSEILSKPLSKRKNS